MLQHLKARKDWDNKALTAKGFTLIELLVVIVILGILAGVVIFAIGSIQDRAQKNSCTADQDTIKTAIAAWNTQYASGDTGDIFDTKYPTGMADLTVDGEGFLEKASKLMNVSGSGSTYPSFTTLDEDKCPQADIDAGL